MLPQQAAGLAQPRVCVVAAVAVFFSFFGGPLSPGGDRNENCTGGLLLCRRGTARCCTHHGPGATPGSGGAQCRASPAAASGFRGATHCFFGATSYAALRARHRGAAADGWDAARRPVRRRVKRKKNTVEWTRSKSTEKPQALHRGGCWRNSSPPMEAAARCCGCASDPERIIVPVRSARAGGRIPPAMYNESGILRSGDDATGRAAQSRCRVASCRGTCPGGAGSVRGAERELRGARARQQRFRRRSKQGAGTRESNQRGRATLQRGARRGGGHAPPARCGVPDHLRTRACSCAAPLVNRREEGTRQRATVRCYRRVHKAGAATRGQPARESALERRTSGVASRWGVPRRSKVPS